MPDLESILVMPREKLKTFKRSSDFLVDPVAMGPDARLSIYTLPVPGHRYAAGGDTAFGIEGRDYDALVVNDISVTPVEQVAELEGRWGAEYFDRIVYAILRYYFNAFFVCERQTNGLALLRSLVSNFDYGYIYYDRAEVKKGRRRSDVLGFSRHTGDVTIPQFQRAVADKQYIARSDRFISQIHDYEFRPKGKVRDKTEDMRDVDLTTGAPTGGNDDLCLAGAYSWKAVLEMPKFEENRPLFEEGKAGDVLGMGEVFIEKPRNAPRVAFANRANLPASRGRSMDFGNGR